jgi:hypothetical protein
LLATTALTLPLAAAASGGIAVNAPGIWLDDDLVNEAAMIPFRGGIMTYGTIGGGLVSANVALLGGAAIDLATAIANLASSAPPNSPLRASLQNQQAILQQDLSLANSALQAALAKCSCGEK